MKIIKTYSDNPEDFEKSMKMLIEYMIKRIRKVNAEKLQEEKQSPAT